MVINLENSILIRFISGYLNIPVSVVDMNPDFFLAFEKEHCFSAELQQEFTTEAMELFCRSIKKPCFYELRSVLNICAILFRFNDQVFLVGPYVELEWKDQVAATLLAQHGLSSSNLLPYKFYYCNYNIIKSSTILPLCTAGIQALDPTVSIYKYQLISALNISTIEKNIDTATLDYNEIIQRYKSEREFLNMVKQGKTNEALEAFSRLSEYQITHIYSFQNIYSMLNGFTTLRTLLRKSAEEVGVHPTTLESLSCIYTPKLHNVKTTSQIRRLSQDIIFDYTKAVQDVLDEKYSLVVKKTISYVKLHLGTPLTLQNMAMAAGVVPNYLSQVFKAETGMTLMKYIAKRRCDIAAELLTSTTLSIAEISHHVGYTDNNYFVKVFKSQLKLTPSDYRQKYF